MDRPSLDNALEAANLALTGQKHDETSRFASVELRTVDAATGAWEMAAAACIGFATLTFVVGAWLY